MSKINILKNRIYSDYFLPNRLSEYELLLKYALDAGYMITSVVNYYDCRRNGKLPADKKIIICRHDIDTDSSSANVFLKIEQNLDVQASYYFRLSTLNLDLMSKIEKYGSEASYHYEEIASYCKKHRIKNREIVFKHMKQIQESFVENYFSIKRKSSLKMRTVCSHGDFINRYFQITNTELLTPETREVCGIECEAYDPIIKSGSLNISDNPAPKFWKEESPFMAIKRGEKIINLLTHPRHWRVSYWSNTKDNIQRAWSGLLFHYL